MRRYDHSWPDEPEAIICERIEAIAFDVERFGGAIARDAERMADALERIADALEGEDDILPDGGEPLPDDSSMRCYDCERVVDRRHISLTEVPIDNEDGPGYEYVPVPLCEDCRLRRYGVKCEHCGEHHWDHEAVFECGRDRGRLLPDGGIDEELVKDLREAYVRLDRLRERAADADLGAAQGGLELAMKQVEKSIEAIERQGLLGKEDLATDGGRDVETDVVEADAIVRLSTPFTVIETHEDEWGIEMVTAHAGGTIVQVPVSQAEVIGHVR